MRLNFEFAAEEDERHAAAAVVHNAVAMREAEVGTTLELGILSRPMRVRASLGVALSNSSPGRGRSTFAEAFEIQRFSRPIPAPETAVTLD